MPVYDFECPKHDVFEASLTLAEYDVAKSEGEVKVACPKCDGPSKLVLAKPLMTHPSWRV